MAGPGSLGGLGLPSAGLAEFEGVDLSAATGTPDSAGAPDASSAQPLSFSSSSLLLEFPNLSRIEVLPPPRTPPIVAMRVRLRRTRRTVSCRRRRPVAGLRPERVFFAGVMYLDRSEFSASNATAMQRPVDQLSRVAASTSQRPCQDSRADAYALLLPIGPQKTINFTRSCCIVHHTF